MIAQILYGWLVVVGLLDLALVFPALWRATRGETRGRLWSTLLVLAGLVLASGSRLFDLPDVPTTVAVGLALVDVGLLGYALFLPERGLLRRRFAP